MKRIAWVVVNRNGRLPVPHIVDSLFTSKERAEQVAKQWAAMVGKKNPNSELKVLRATVTVTGEP